MSYDQRVTLMLAIIFALLLIIVGVEVLHQTSHKLSSSNQKLIQSTK